MAPKYKEGDRVRIKSIDWYNENKDPKHEYVDCGNGIGFYKHMTEHCGKVMTISEIWDYCYGMEGHVSAWTDEMIEGLVEEETKPKYEDEVNGEYYSTPKYLVRPSGYQFIDENGNVINAQKIVLEKKKKEYPKTYEESVDVLEGAAIVDIITYYYSKQLIALYKLLICRDAYWKIAGEEMGLGKPWELSIGTPIYYIYYNRTVGTIKNDYADDIQGNIILAFPTEEMRDAFYENFKELIEQCKELL